MTVQLQPGEAFGEYVLERRLGAGGFGDVWLSHNSVGRRVAVKILHGDYQDSETGKMRGEIELLAAAALSRSVHIVHVLGGSSDPVPHVVLEYIDGVDVAQELARCGALPVPDVLHIAAGIADALGALQQAGIIHRDVKPANVMIDNHGVVKLTDFGIAKIVGIDSMTATNQVMMSVAYAAPEVFDGQTSHRSDHYAFGALLYQCLAGRPMFQGNYAQIYRQHLNGAPDMDALPPETPPSLRALIGRCLAKDPAERPANAMVLRNAIEAAQVELLAEQDPSLVPDSTQEPTRLGPWIIDGRSDQGQWTFTCHHESTGEQALVEVHFSDDLDYGARLRREVNSPLERSSDDNSHLPGTSRLVLRPGENFAGAPPDSFIFWVARSTAPSVGGRLLQRSAAFDRSPYISAGEPVSAAYTPEVDQVRGPVFTGAAQVSPEIGGVPQAEGRRRRRPSWNSVLSFALFVAFLGAFAYSVERNHGPDNKGSVPWQKAMLDDNSKLPGMYVPPHPGADGIVCKVASCVASSDDRAHLATGVQVPICTQDQIAANQLSNPLCYNSNPPTSGPHSADLMPFKVLDNPAAKEYLVHNMEHGGIVIWYNSDNQDVVKQLETIVNSNLDRHRFVVMTKYSEMEADTIALTAWTRLDKFRSGEFDRKRVQDFIDAHEKRFNPEGF